MGLPVGKGMCAGQAADLGSGLNGQDTEGLLAAPGSSTCPARDEDAIKWPKLCIHFPLDLHDFIFILYVFISYIFILFRVAFCPLLPFHTKLPMALPGSSFWQVCAR